MCWVFTEKSECSRMTNHDRSCSCLPLRLPKSRPQPFLCIHACHLMLQWFHEDAIFREICTAEHISESASLSSLSSLITRRADVCTGCLYFSWGKMLLGKTFCCDGVFEVSWTDIFNILLQESIPIVWPDCGQQKNVLSVLCNIEKTIMITSSLNYRPVSL